VSLWLFLPLALSIKAIDGGRFRRFRVCYNDLDGVTKDGQNRRSDDMDA
jgi:hypothetical protein